MKSIFYSATFFLTFFTLVGASAQPLIKAEKLSSHQGQRTSSIGATFAKDESLPGLGEAYRDPTGLIWGSLMMAEGKVITMNQYDAEKYCENKGARLPTRKELHQLAKYLGEGTRQNYNPHLSDGKTDILPGLADQPFCSWSSTLYEGHPEFANVFCGFSGLVGGAPRQYEQMSFRCVTKR